MKFDLKSLNLKWVGIGVIALVLIAMLISNSDESNIKSAIEANLNDPGSAQFGDVVISENGDRACAEWNARNGYGGYGESSIAELRKGDDGWTVTKMEGLSQNCDTLGFAVLDARENAEDEAELRLWKIMDEAPQFGGKSAELTMGVGPCSDAMINYQILLGDHAEYRLRSKAGDLSEDSDDPMRQALQKAKAIEKIVRSGSCETFSVTEPSY